MMLPIIPTTVSIIYWTSTLTLLIVNITLSKAVLALALAHAHAHNLLSIATESFVNHDVSIQPPQSHMLTIDNIVLKIEAVQLLTSTFQELNLQSTEINNRVHDICHNFVNDFMKSERDIENYISKQKYESQKQNWNNIVNKYTNPYYGITTTLPEYNTIIEINHEGKPLDEQDYFTIYKHKIIDGEQKIMNTMRMKQALLQLCGTTSPVPVFQIDIKTGIFFSTANEFTVKTTFQNPESISIVSSIVSRQISILKLLFAERNDMTESERLYYISLEERYELFLDMIIMSSMFIIHENDLESTIRFETVLHHLEYLMNQYKSNINRLQKDLFPIQSKQWEEAIQLTISNSRHQFQKDTMKFTHYLYYFKPVTTLSWEFGEYLQNNTMLAFRNLDSRTIEPFMNFVDNICYRIVKIIITLFILYLIVNLIGVFAPSIVQYFIQKIYNIL